MHGAGLLGLYAYKNEGRRNSMAERSKHRNAAIAAIRTCVSLDTLEDILRRFELTDSAEIIELLNECMFNPERFYCPGGKVSPDENLEMTKEIFLTGIWKISEFHEARVPHESGLGYANV